MQPLRQIRMLFYCSELFRSLVFGFQIWIRFRHTSKMRQNQNTKLLDIACFSFYPQKHKIHGSGLKKIGCIEASLIFAERKNLVLTIFRIWIVKILKFVQNNLGKKDVGNNLKLGCRLPSGENLCKILSGENICQIPSGVKIVVEFHLLKICVKFHLMK